MQAETDTDTKRAGKNGERGEIQADDAQGKQKTQSDDGVLAEDGKAVADAKISDFREDPAVGKRTRPAPDTEDDVDEQAHEQQVHEGKLAIFAAKNRGFQDGKQGLDTRGMGVPVENMEKKIDQKNEATPMYKRVQGIDDILRPEYAVVGVFQRVALGPQRCILGEREDADPDEDKGPDVELVFGDTPGEVEVASAAGCTEKKNAGTDKVREYSQDAVDVGIAVVSVEVSDGTARQTENRPAYQQHVETEDETVGINGVLVGEDAGSQNDKAEKQDSDESDGSHWTDETVMVSAFHQVRVNKDAYGKIRNSNEKQCGSGQ